MLLSGMTRHHTLPRFIATAALGLVLLSACSSSSSSTELAAGTTSTTDASTTVVDTTVVDDAVAPSTTVLAPTTSAAPATTAPSSTTPPMPPPTIAPSIAPPPPACITPGVESEPVELVITDNGVLFNGAPAPSCMRVPESFRFRFTNNAEGDATVAFGDGSGTVFAGNSELTDPLGEIFFVGDEFQIAIAELATVIDVTVIA
jgi:hypothetical protein